MIKTNNKIKSFFVMISFPYLYFINILNVKAETCTQELLGVKLAGILQNVFTGIQIATPVLLLILISADMLRAVTSGKDEDMKKAQGNAVKRIIVGVIIFFIPTIVNLILNLIGSSAGTCGIG